MEKLLFTILIQGGEEYQGKDYTIEVHEEVVEEGKKLHIYMGPQEELINGTPTVVSNVFLDTVKLVNAIKQSMEVDKCYEQVFTLTKKEYTEYVRKVLGIKI